VEKPEVVSTDPDAEDALYWPEQGKLLDDRLLFSLDEDMPTFRLLDFKQP